jgi:hypothetical protein
MKTDLFFENFDSEAIIRVAKRNYNTYVKHNEARNFKPMKLEEFLKNYKHI